MAELSLRFALQSTSIQQWEQMLLDEGMLIFERGVRTAKSPEPHADPNEPHRKLGECRLWCEISVKCPCELLAVGRSSSYRALHSGPVRDRVFRDAIEGIDERHPFYGKRRVQVELRKQGLEAGVRAHPPSDAGDASGAGPSEVADEPYQPRATNSIRICCGIVRWCEATDAVWASDIRYIPMRRGGASVSGFDDRLARSPSAVVAALQQSGPRACARKH